MFEVYTSDGEELHIGREHHSISQVLGTLVDECVAAIEIDGSGVAGSEL